MQAVLVMFRSDGERRSFSVTRDVTVIGRREDCDLRIPIHDVSRKHARLIRDGEALRLEDLGSSNGTYLNGHRIERDADLQAGDSIQVGPIVFVLQVEGWPADEELNPITAESVAQAAMMAAPGAMPTAPGAHEDELEPLGDDPTLNMGHAGDDQYQEGDLEPLDEFAPADELQPVDELAPADDLGGLDDLHHEGDASAEAPVDELGELEPLDLADEEPVAAPPPPPAPPKPPLAKTLPPKPVPAAKAVPPKPVPPPPPPPAASAPIPLHTDDDDLIPLVEDEPMAITDDQPAGEHGQDDGLIQMDEHLDPVADDDVLIDLAPDPDPKKH